MRFSYCKGLIVNKSFCIYSIEYFFENEFNSVLLRSFGISKFFHFFCFMLFEFHNSNYNIRKNFYELGLAKSKNFAKLLLFYFQPHLNLQNFFFLNVVRYLRPTTQRGTNLALCMPTHGQRTHSNSKTIHRFKFFVINNLLQIPGINLRHPRDYLQKALTESNDDDIMLKIKPLKPVKKIKQKQSPKGTKKTKKKKLDV